MGRIPLLRMVADLLFPPSCPACGRTGSDDGTDWCEACVREFLAARLSDYCPRCGLAAEPYRISPAGCPECRQERSAIDGIARVGTYEGPVGQLVKRFKFGHRQQLDRVLGEWLAAAIDSRPWRGRIDALVPVPTTLSSRLRYRCQPASLLAAAAGRQLGLPVLPLLRVRGKRRRQTGLPRSDRASNIRGAFSLHQHARVGGAVLCVIDDVSTSGSTLQEIARLLQRAGAAHVYAAVVARTDPVQVQA